MRPVLELIERVGPSDANVLITGESGTGKGLIAGVLHSVSARNKRPLVTVNTGGLSEGIFESEVFGHVRGAFTDAKTDRVGHIAHGVAVDISVAHVVEERSVDVPQSGDVIAAIEVQPAHQRHPPFHTGNPHRAALTLRQIKTTE